MQALWFLLLVIVGFLGVGFLFMKLDSRKRVRSGRNASTSVTVSPASVSVPVNSRATVIRNVQPGAAWGEISYEEIGPAFLDSFLIRNFHSILKSPAEIHMGSTVRPWDDFCEANSSWLRGMPRVFLEMTGYELDPLQLDRVAVAYFERTRVKL